MLSTEWDIKCRINQKVLQMYNQIWLFSSLEPLVTNLVESFCLLRRTCRIYGLCFTWHFLVLFSDMSLYAVILACPRTLYFLVRVFVFHRRQQSMSAYALT